METEGGGDAGAERNWFSDWVGSGWAALSLTQSAEDAGGRGRSAE